ncbi:hypothetical protein O6H91_12G063900 [Diphasiastrum complanatum]|uniref:Uncharacterized protein n=1 Tax=Diphasiastrum complanatum TaxID=34168 RepID=A0ACC2C2L8_DIPCM|nr:hypothetical protein O6H91_12G063900 [Diphasiastrum complanatum]
MLNVFSKKSCQSMEQKTWPMGSDGRLIFSSSPSSSSKSMRRTRIEKPQNASNIRGLQNEPHDRGYNPDLRRLELQIRQTQNHASDFSESHRDTDRHLSHENVTLINNSRVLQSLATKRGTFSEKIQKNEPSGLEKRFWADEAGHRLNNSNFCKANSLVLRSTCKEVEEARDNFKNLPFDVLKAIAGGFSWPNLWAASMVCQSWCQALAPLREAMLFVRWGKKLKHGRGGVAQNLDKALDSFLKGAARGCAAAMVDAGLLLWEQCVIQGRRNEGIKWYKKAAELGDPAGQCNLGLAYLQESIDPTEAVKWFQRAAVAGHVRAQYTLAVCLQQGRGVECNTNKAAKWYLRAAEGGSLRAMYNTALCYTSGEGVKRDYREARKWMRRAALAGHRKAQFEHGLTLFAEGDGGLALVFLELATRAGETGATHIRDVLLQQLSPKMRAHAIACADKWQVKALTPKVHGNWSAS